MMSLAPPSHRLDPSPSELVSRKQPAEDKGDKDSGKGPTGSDDGGKPGDDDGGKPGEGSGGKRKSTKRK
eukprot:4853289-Alexandrium_andersonii.AAC.1